MTDIEGAEPEPGPTGSSRTFWIIAALLAVPAILAVVIGGIVVLGRVGQEGSKGDVAATQTVEANGTAIAVAMLTQQAAAPTRRPTQAPTVKPTNTLVGPSPTRLVVPTNTPPVVRASDTPAAPPTQIGVGATPTRIGGGGLPPGGIGSETGGLTIVLAGLGLLAVLVVARKLRTR